MTTYERTGTSKLFVVVELVGVEKERVNDFPQLQDLYRSLECVSRSFGSRATQQLCGQESDQDPRLIF